MKSFYGFLLLYLFTISQSRATHILGGNIAASYISGQTYKITVSLYMDVEKGGAAAANQLTVPICFGDGNTAEASRVSQTIVGTGVALARYENTYNYPTSGSFQISAAITSRSADYVNLPSDGSDKFFIWTVINTDFNNSTPILNAAEMTAGVRQVFTADLSPAVPDNDSISIRLMGVSSPSPGTCGVRLLQKTFFYPNDLTKAGTFKVDNKSKKLIWTAPERVGKYVYSFVVDEWRNGIVISQTYYERSVVVTDRPGDLAVVPEYEPAGQLITATPNPSDSPESPMTMNAYPVPATDYLTFKVYSQKRAVITVRLVDLKGIIVKEIASENLEFEFESIIDVRQLTPGLYILQSGNGMESVSKKIVR